MEFNILIKNFFQEIGNSKKMVLSTSYNDIVTSRMMSIIIMDHLFYFQTDRSFRKYEQIKKNPNVSLCMDNLSIEGLCLEIGHPLDNKTFCQLYEKYYKNSYERYSSLKEERLFVIHPKYIQKWIYDNSKPYIEIYDMNAKTYTKKHYEAT